jgi:hypothetical protein
MVKRFALVGTLTLVLAAVAMPAYAQMHVSIGIGAPFYPPVAVVTAAPYPGYVWQPARYVWTAFGYQLVPGGWVPAAYYAPYYAPHGLPLGLGFNVGHLGYGDYRGYRGYGGYEGYRGYGGYRGYRGHGGHGSRHR